MTTTDPTPDLAAIDRRHKAFEDAWDHEYMAPDGPAKAAASAEDVPALIAEVQRLRAVTTLPHQVAPEVVETALAAQREHIFATLNTCACGYPPTTGPDWERHRMQAALEAVANMNDPMPKFNNGGWLPSEPARVTVAPTECILKPGEDGIWQCVRADAVHTEAGHDLAAGVSEAGEWRLPRQGGEQP